MKIKSFEVIGLFQKENHIKLNFHDDINIITGRNGSGKTSILKLLWYIISGHIFLGIKEVNFKKAKLITDLYDCTITKTGRYTCKIDWRSDDFEGLFEDLEDDDGDVWSNAEDQANELLAGKGKSVFLPTFRRIEGGFTIGERINNNPLLKSKGDIEESLITLSKKLSNENHVFVSSLSTVDIVNLLVQEYTNLSEKYNKIHQNTSQEIIEKIRTFKTESSSGNQLNEANKVLDDIRNKVQMMESEREDIMKPIEAVRLLAIKIFKHSGIKITNSLSFGDAANAIHSDALSAGEKQMFSFIAYNAFYTNSVFIIDEPELSLHVDWQRQLFPTLKSQQATNQFIIATHSPFIYSKYPEKEININIDKGE